MTEVCCPACGSTLRVELETVRMTKPRRGEQLELAQARLRAVGTEEAPLPEGREERAVRAIERALGMGGPELWERLRSRSRSRGDVLLRQAAMAAAVDAGATYALVGELLERDHTTVMHGARAHRARQAA